MPLVQQVWVECDLCKKKAGEPSAGEWGLENRACVKAWEEGFIQLRMDYYDREDQLNCPTEAKCWFCSDCLARSHSEVLQRLLGMPDTKFGISVRLDGDLLPEPPSEQQVEGQTGVI